MPKLTQLQTNFTAGEVSPRIFGRVDVARYQNGAETMENVIATVHGGALRRGGFRYIASAMDSLTPVRLASFVFNVEQAYVLEFGDERIRFYRNGGQITSGGSTYEISSPYTADMLADIDYTQRNDTMFIFHPDVPIHRLRRFAHDYWHLEEVPFDAEPYDEIGHWPAFDLVLDDTVVSTGRTGAATGACFLASDVGRIISSTSGRFEITSVTSDHDVTGDILSAFQSGGWYLNAGDWQIGGTPKTTLTPSVATPIGGSVTLTTTDDAWRSEDVGKYVAVNSGLILISAYTDAKHVTGIIQRELASTVAAPSDAWVLYGSIWNERDGYPRTGTLFQQRLVVGGSPGYPQRYCMSRTGFSADFTPGTEDTDGFSYDVESDEANGIVFLTSVRTLLALTYGYEFTIEGGVEKPITPTNPQVKSRSNIGCSAVRPVRVRNEEFFVQRSGLSIHALSYNVTNDDYLSPEVTTLAEHITESGIREMSFKQRPESILCCVRNDGQMATLTLDRDQEVIAWTRQITQGSFESTACIPGANGDEWYVSVAREINGSTVRTIEIYDASANVDCFVYGEDPAGASVWTCAHLEGETVQVVADGCYVGDFVVSGGEVTLPNEVNSVTIGLGYDTTIDLLTPEVVSQEGSAQGAKMRTSALALRFLDTYGAKVNDRQLFDIGGGDPQPFSGIKKIGTLGWGDGESPVRITQDIPMPFHLLSVMRVLTVNNP